MPTDSRAVQEPGHGQPGEQVAHAGQSTSTHPHSPLSPAPPVAHTHGAHTVICCCAMERLPLGDLALLIHDTLIHTPIATATATARPVKSDYWAAAHGAHFLSPHPRPLPLRHMHIFVGSLALVRRRVPVYVKLCPAQNTCDSYNDMTGGGGDGDGDCGERHAAIDGFGTVRIRMYCARSRPNGASSSTPVLKHMPAVAPLARLQAQ